MKFFICITIIFGFVAVGQAVIGRADFSHPSYPGKCVLDNNNILSPGENFKAPNIPCAGATCMQGGKVIIKTCPAVPPPKGCRMRNFVNTNRPYPACCERNYECNHNA